jgi:hypothetical protein
MNGLRCLLQRRGQGNLSRGGVGDQMRSKRSFKFEIVAQYELNKCSAPNGLGRRPPTFEIYLGKR